VLQRAGLNATRFDEGVDLRSLQPDDTTEAICGKLSFVDEAVEREG
jgi:hypothetical protein